MRTPSTRTIAILFLLRALPAWCFSASTLLSPTLLIAQKKIAFKPNESTMTVAAITLPSQPKSERRGLLAGGGATGGVEASGMGKLLCAEAYSRRRHPVGTWKRRQHSNKFVLRLNSRRPKYRISDVEYRTPSTQRLDFNSRLQVLQHFPPGH